MEKKLTLILNMMIASSKRPLEIGFKSPGVLLTKRKAQETVECLIGEIQELISAQEAAFNQEKGLFEISRCRIRHLRTQLEFIREGTPACQSVYLQDKLNRGIISYLFSRKLYKTAEHLIAHLKLEKICLLEGELHKEFQEIQESLKEQSCQKALQWTSSYRARLQKIGSDLEFQLIFQQFIELLKKGETMEALRYLRSTSKHFKAENHPIIMKAMGCLVLCRGTTGPKESLALFKNQYESFFKESRWSTLSEQFTKNYSQIIGIKPSSSLEVLLSAGVATLKTPFCHDPVHTKPESCPLCNKWMMEISHKIPATQKNISTLLCRITGSPINENNPAVALPNSEVYSLGVILSPFLLLILPGILSRDSKKS